MRSRASAPSRSAKPSGADDAHASPSRSRAAATKTSPPSCPMSRIDRLFEARRAAGKRVFVVYLCVGDPSLDASVKVAKAALEAGADILELGVPFSDTTADGPAIARASERAIRAGSSLVKTLEVAAAL